ncbi:hypothetical protein BDY21DRAFT_349110 [Lineolata rhizophorae]|uniref:Uncharacterized protein n=1 Tax=Lineolata rhizophorae TaxID=578093 RepID=A0A6A6NXD5_9PEZI|nr:hypothetical protein BDY21DRAFT_349110 [Lineolata rhizophorae]
MDLAPPFPLYFTFCSFVVAATGICRIACMNGTTLLYLVMLSSLRRRILRRVLRRRGEVVGVGVSTVDGLYKEPRAELGGERVTE